MYPFKSGISRHLGLGSRDKSSLVQNCREVSVEISCRYLCRRRQFQIQLQTFIANSEPLRAQKSQFKFGIMIAIIINWEPIF